PPPAVRARRQAVRGARVRIAGVLAAGVEPDEKALRAHPVEGGSRQRVAPTAERRRVAVNAPEAAGAPRRGDRDRGRGLPAHGGADGAPPPIVGASGAMTGVP